MTLNKDRSVKINEIKKQPTNDKRKSSEIRERFELNRKKVTK